MIKTSIHWLLSARFFMGTLNIWPHLFYRRQMKYYHPHFTDEETEAFSYLPESDLPVFSPSQWFSSVQFSSVTQSCPTLCDPMNRSTPGLPVHHQLPEFIQTHVHQVSDAIQPSHPRSSPSPPAHNPSQHQSLFQWVNSAWGGQSTGVSALASFLPKKSQGWSPSEWTGWISLQSKGLSRVSNTTVQKHQFFGAQPSSQSNSHIPTWPQEKP